MPKRLLVTSDDFGMCHSVNAGIVRAMTEGMVRSTNFLVPCPWFPHALDLAKRHRLLAGVHLCVTCDWDLYRWGPLTRAESLRDEHGYFLPDHDAVAGQATESDIHDELLAQIQRVKAMGYEPTHLDTHMTGSASTGPYFDMLKGIVKRLGDRFGLVYTYEREGNVLRHFRDECEISTLPEAEIFERLASFEEDGAYHLIGHAAEPAAELDEMATPAHPSKPWTVAYRQRDIAFFLDPKSRNAIDRLGFELVTVPQLLDAPAA
jgi:predicted glycoside hydrolase/deacetylase ChbG (UPF0249 family)